MYSYTHILIKKLYSSFFWVGLIKYNLTQKKRSKKKTSQKNSNFLFFFSQFFFF